VKQKRVGSSAKFVIEVIKQCGIAYDIHLWVRCLSLLGIISGVLLLLWISGGFPPKAWLLLLQAAPRLPRLFNARGPHIGLSLVALVALSLTWLALWGALLGAGMAMVLRWGRNRSIQHEQQVTKIGWEPTRSNHNGGRKRTSTQFFNPADAFSEPSEYARAETQKAPTSTHVQARKMQEMDAAVLRTEHVGIGWNAGIARRFKPNEDSLVALHSTCTHNGRLLPLDLYVVADGMGGHSHGQEAGHLAVECMIQAVVPDIISSDHINGDFLVETLVEGVQWANQRVHESGQQSGVEMGTTITAALVFDGSTYIVNVGDSRTYIYREREGQLSQVTRDHSLVARLVEAGAISRDEVYTHPDRNKVYRGLGDKDPVKVDWFTVPVHTGDYLVLCSDGLWEMVRDKEIERILKKCAGDPPQASAALVKAALEGGGADNISVIVVRVR
jgi:serine/threonine protein phosphatase PrpC